MPMSRHILYEVMYVNLRAPGVFTVHNSRHYSTATEMDVLLDKMNLFHMWEKRSWNQDEWKFQKNHKQLDDYIA